MPHSSQPQDGLTLPAPTGMDDQDLQSISLAADEITSAPEIPEAHEDSSALPEPATAQEATPATPYEQTPEPPVVQSSPIELSLSELKQAALRELSPLVGHLNQTPDEKYETAKMIYEETRDHTALTAVYEAAKNLTDEKAKAEAIYDVIQKISQL